MARRGFSGISGSAQPAGSAGSTANGHGAGIGSDIDGLDGIGTVNPSELGAGAGDAAGGSAAGGSAGSSAGSSAGGNSRTGRKPGRPAGSGNSNRGSGETKSPQAVKSDGQAATALLSSIHQMLALYLQAPAIALTPQEAEDLGSAIAAVQKFYPASVFDPKYTAWAALAMVAFRIEAPRAIIAVNAVKAKKANAPT